MVAFYEHVLFSAIVLMHLLMLELSRYIAGATIIAHIYLNAFHS